MIEATSPGRKPLACRPNATSLEICSHCRQLVGCQMPNFFSRIAGRSPRVSTASTKLFAIVSATVSTAGPAMPVPSSWSCRVPDRWMPGLPGADLTPGFLFFPAPFAPCACFLCAQIEFLNVLRVHQPLAGIVHHHAADFQHIAVMRGLQRYLGVLLDQQDRHALLLVDAADDVENLPDQDGRQAERRLIEQEQRRPVHQRAADCEHLLLTTRQLARR